MNRDEAKEKLKGRANGHFVVRKSSKKGKGTDAHRVHPCRLSTPPPCHKHPPLLIWNPETYCTGHFALSVVTNRRQSKGGLEHLLILPSFAGKDSNAPGNTRYRLGAYYKNKNKESANICRINYPPHWIIDGSARYASPSAMALERMDIFRYIRTYTSS